MGQKGIYDLLFELVRLGLIRMMNDSDIIANKSDMKPIIIGEKTAADSAYEYLFEGAPSIEAQRAAKLFDLEFSNLQDVMCCICADPVPFGEGTTIPGCQHSMCLDCVAKAIVQDQRQCPAKDDGDGNRNCSSMIPTILLRHVLPVADFETIQRNKINVLDDQELVFNTSRFECPICLGRIEPGDGVVLRDCIHEFCLDCLRQTVDHCRDAQVSCPFADHEYSCKAVLQQREVRGVLGDQMAYDRLISQCLRVAEGKLANTFHCLTADCSGFCVLEDDQDMFWCEVCDAKNCLICQVIKN